MAASPRDMRAALHRARLRVTRGLRVAYNPRTDGKPDDWSEDDFRSVREASAELDVHLLTYALGSGAAFDRVKRLACENKGIAQKVEDAQDDRLANAMASYYQMLGPMRKPCQTRWVGYTDILSGEYLLTGCMAAFETLDGSTAPSCATAKRRRRCSRARLRSSERRSARRSAMCAA